MAEISKITLPTGNTYDIKDETARNLIAALNNWEYIVSTDAASTPYGVSWDDDGTTITGTLVASDDTTYKIYLVPSLDTTGNDNFKEYITITKDEGVTYRWEMFGSIVTPDLSNYVSKDEAGALAYKDSASGTVVIPKTYTTTTSVATSESKAVSVSGTTTGSVSLTKGTVDIKPNSTGTAANKYTPAGSVSSSFSGTASSGTISGTATAPTISVKTAGTTGKVTGITSVGSMPTYSVSNEVLTITAGVTPTADTEKTFKTGDATYQAGTSTVSGSCSVTPSGSVESSFTGTDTYLKTAVEVGTDASFTGAAMTSTGSVEVPNTFTSNTTTETTESKTVTVS